MNREDKSLLSVLKECQSSPCPESLPCNVEFQNSKNYVDSCTVRFLDYDAVKEDQNSEYQKHSRDGRCHRKSDYIFKNWKFWLIILICFCIPLAIWSGRDPLAKRSQKLSAESDQLRPSSQDYRPSFPIRIFASASPLQDRDEIPADALERLGEEPFKTIEAQEHHDIDDDQNESVMPTKPRKRVFNVRYGFVVESKSYNNHNDKRPTIWKRLKQAWIGWHHRPAIPPSIPSPRPPPYRTSLLQLLTASAPINERTPHIGTEQKALLLHQLANVTSDSTINDIRGVPEPQTSSAETIAEVAGTFISITFKYMRFYLVLEILAHIYRIADPVAAWEYLVAGWDFVWDTAGEDMWNRFQDSLDFAADVICAGLNMRIAFE